MRPWREQRPRRRRPPRRIRRKLLLGEFTQYGVQIRFDCDLPIDSAELDDAMDQFLQQCDAVGLAVGGGMGGGASEFFGTSMTRKPRNPRRFRHAQLNKLAVQAVERFLSAQSWCRNLKMTIRDASYGPFEGSRNTYELCAVGIRIELFSEPYNL